MSFPLTVTVTSMTTASQFCYSDKNNSDSNGDNSGRDVNGHHPMRHHHHRHIGHNHDGIIKAMTMISSPPRITASIDNQGNNYHHTHGHLDDIIVLDNVVHFNENDVDEYHRISTNRTNHLHRRSVPLRKQSVFVAPTGLGTILNQTSPPPSTMNVDDNHEKTARKSHYLSDEDISQRIAKLIQENSAIVEKTTPTTNRFAGVNNIGQSHRKSTHLFVQPGRMPNQPQTTGDYIHHHSSKTTTPPSKTYQINQAQQQQRSLQLTPPPPPPTSIPIRRHSTSVHHHHNHPSNRHYVIATSHSPPGHVTIQQTQPQQQVITNDCSNSSYSKLHSALLGDKQQQSHTEMTLVTGSYQQNWSIPQRPSICGSSTSHGSFIASSYNQANPIQRKYSENIITSAFHHHHGNYQQSTAMSPFVNRTNQHHSSRSSNDLFPSLYQHSQQTMINPKPSVIINTRDLLATGQQQKLESGMMDEPQPKSQCLVRNLLLRNSGPSSSAASQTTNSARRMSMSRLPTTNANLSTTDMTKLSNQQNPSQHQSPPPSVLGSLGPSNTTNSGSQTSDNSCIIKDLLLKSSLVAIDNPNTNSTTTFSSNSNTNNITVPNGPESHLPPRKRSRTNLTASQQQHESTQNSPPNKQPQQMNAVTCNNTPNTTATVHTCQLCLVKFRNEQNLEIHQKFYCNGGSANHPQPSETDSQDSVKPQTNRERKVSVLERPSIITYSNGNQEQSSTPKRSFRESFTNESQDNTTDLNKKQDSVMNKYNFGNILKTKLLSGYEQELSGLSLENSNNPRDSSSMDGDDIEFNYEYHCPRHQQSNNKQGPWPSALVLKKRKTSEPAFRFGCGTASIINNSNEATNSNYYYLDSKSGTSGTTTSSTNSMANSTTIISSSFQSWSNSVFSSLQTSSADGDFDKCHLKSLRESYPLEIIPAYMPYLIRSPTKITLKGPVLFPVLQNLIDNHTNHEFNVVNHFDHEDNEDLDLIEDNDSDLMIINDETTNHQDSMTKFFVKQDEEIWEDEQIEKLLDDILIQVEEEEEARQKIQQCLTELIDTVADEATPPVRRRKNNILQAFTTIPPQRPTTLALDVVNNGTGRSRRSERYRKTSILVNRCSATTNSSTLNNNAHQLVASTLVSPDTPRSKQKYQQLSLNGNAYSNLGLKVSLRVTYCCIYRLQPMFVMQEANPQLSMYSQWATHPIPDGDVLHRLKSPIQLLSAYDSQEAVFVHAQTRNNLVNHVGAKAKPHYQSEQLKPSQNNEEPLEQGSTIDEKVELDDENTNQHSTSGLGRSTSLSLKTIGEFLQKCRSRLSHIITNVTTFQSISNECSGTGKNSSLVCKITPDRTLKSAIYGLDGDGFTLRLRDTSTRTHFILTHSNYHRQQQQVSINSQTINHKQNNRVSFSTNLLTLATKPENSDMGLCSISSPLMAASSTVASSGSDSMISTQQTESSSLKEKSNQKSSSTIVDQQQQNSVCLSTFNPYLTMHPMLGHLPEKNKQAVMYIMMMSQTPATQSVPTVQQIMSATSVKNLASRKFSECIGLKPSQHQQEQDSHSGWNRFIIGDGVPDLNDLHSTSIPKRIKIFEGGFKSNEDYTYIRGRGRGKYICGECGIRCKKPSMLKKHIRTHTDLRPYSCRYCAFAFKTKGNLTKHMKSKAHHKKCVELGIIPVPTSIDDSQIDIDALAKQEQYELNCNGGSGDGSNFGDGLSSGAGQITDSQSFGSSTKTNNGNQTMSKNQHRSSTFDAYDEDDELDDDCDIDEDEDEDDEGVPIAMMENHYPFTNQNNSQLSSANSTNNKNRLTNMEPGQFDDALEVGDDNKNKSTNQHLSPKRKRSGQSINNNSGSPSTSPSTTSYQQHSEVIKPKVSKEIANEIIGVGSGLTSSSIINSKKKSISPPSSTTMILKSLNNSRRRSPNANDNSLVDDNIRNSDNSMENLNHNYQQNRITVVSSSSSTSQTTSSLNSTPMMMSSSTINNCNITSSTTTETTTRANTDEVEAVRSLLILSSGTNTPSSSTTTNNSGGASISDLTFHSPEIVNDPVETTIIETSPTIINNLSLSPTKNNQNKRTPFVEGQANHQSQPQIIYLPGQPEYDQTTTTTIFKPIFVNHSQISLPPQTTIYDYAQSVDNNSSYHARRPSPQPTLVPSNHLSPNHRPQQTATPANSTNMTQMQNSVANQTSVIIVNHQSTSAVSNSETDTGNRKRIRAGSNSNEGGICINPNAMNLPHSITTLITNTTPTIINTSSNRPQQPQQIHITPAPNFDSNSNPNPRHHLTQQKLLQIYSNLSSNGQILSSKPTVPQQTIQATQVYHPPLPQSETIVQIPSKLSRSSPLALNNNSGSSLPPIVEQSLNRYVQENQNRSSSNPIKTESKISDHSSSVTQQQDQPIDLSAKAKATTETSNRNESPVKASVNSAFDIPTSVNHYSPSSKSVVLEKQHLTERIVQSFSSFDYPQQMTSIGGQPYGNRQQTISIHQQNGHQLYQTLRSEEFAHLTPGVHTPHSLPRNIQMMMMRNSRTSSGGSPSPPNRQQSSSPSDKTPSPSKANLQSTFNGVEGKPTCPTCMKQFTKPEQLRLHYKIHSFERLFKCESCAVSFRTKGHLQKHARSVSHMNKLNMSITFGRPSSDNPRPFKCSDCKIAFRIHGHLAKHLRSKMHIMKLECLGKLPFGMYAEMERNNINVGLIDTTDCGKALETLQSLAQQLYDPRQMCWKDIDSVECLATSTSANSITRKPSESESQIDSEDGSIEVIEEGMTDDDEDEEGVAVADDELEDNPNEKTKQTSIVIDSNEKLDLKQQTCVLKNTPVTSNTVTSITHSTITRSNTCHHCGRQFKASKFLQVHLYTEHPEDC